MNVKPGEVIYNFLLNKWSPAGDLKNPTSGVTNFLGQNNIDWFFYISNDWDN